MSATSTTHFASDDPFAGCDPGPLRCQWLTADDQRRAPEADVIRLIVDDQRGHCDGWANAVYQRRFFRDVQDFIGPNRAVMVTDAGAIKGYVPALVAVEETLSGLSTILSRVDLPTNEMLVGLDGCVEGGATHFQGVAHLRGPGLVDLANTTVKLYPTEDERASLVGWELCKRSGRVPHAMAATRRVETAVGAFVVLVCNDAAILGARSRANLTDPLKLAIREHFLAVVRHDPKPYVLIATHHQEGRGGEVFRQAARYLADETGVTVVTTARAPVAELPAIAERFATVGPNVERVATLLVRDWPGGS